ncbi:MAG: polyphosphate kinase 1 [Cyclobacteriaceae bacterium]
MNRGLPTIKSDEEIIQESRLISRDLSWLQFNYRVLEQAKKKSRSVLEKLKFLAITASNLDEFMMIRVGSLYNYLDYGRKRVDYSGLREHSFKDKLFSELAVFKKEQSQLFDTLIQKECTPTGFSIINYIDLTEGEIRKVKNHFIKVIYPILTPMVYDTLHTFPILSNKVLILAVATEQRKSKNPIRFSFVQIPQNLPRFFELERDGKRLFLPVEQMIRENIDKLFQNVRIHTVSLFRIIRNGDFDWDDYEEYEESFIEEVEKKLKKRKTGRVVQVEIESAHPKKLNKLLRKKFKLEDADIFRTDSLIDLTSLWQLVGHSDLSDLLPEIPKPVAPLTNKTTKEIQKQGLLDFLKEEDLFLHHPYNSFDYVTQLIEEAALDPSVLAIKVTIYRLAKKSRIANALLKAAENGKNVSVLFEVKARFDEENNLKEGIRLQKAGCFVMYGVPQVKTHTKLLFIVRQERNKVTRYVHMSSGNYNESTAKIYSDTSLITTKAAYGRDVSEFFNAVTGHSLPSRYEKLITTPGDMRKSIIRLIRKEAAHAKKGLASGIILKVNSLQDDLVIEELYKASQSGVRIQLIVRGICCIRPQRKGLSENIEVRSVVGDFLEHSRFYYFHNNNTPKIYGGSADIMVRSFNRRIESLFLIEGEAKKMAILILDYNLKDEANTFLMQENGDFIKAKTQSSPPFNLFNKFYKVKKADLENIQLF